MLIGGYRGVERLDRHAFHVLSADDSDGASRVLEDAVVLRGVNDAHLIDIVQLVGNDPHKFVRQTGYSLLEIVEESVHLHVFYRWIQAIVGLELVHHRILFVLDSFVGFVDREVELGDDRAIHPWFSYIVSVLATLVARQKPYDDSHGHADQYGLGHQVAPIVFFRIVEYTHISLFLFFLLDWWESIFTFEYLWIKRSISLNKNADLPHISLFMCENTKKNYYNRKKRCKFAENFENSYKIRHGR